MPEPLSDQRLDHISACLSVPDVGGLSEAFAHELLAEVKRLRARLDTIGLLLPILTATVSGPHRDVRSAELVAKAIAHHHAQPADGDDHA